MVYGGDGPRIGCRVTVIGMHGAPGPFALAWCDQKRGRFAFDLVLCGWACAAGRGVSQQPVGFDGQLCGLCCGL